MIDISHGRDDTINRKEVAGGSRIGVFRDERATSRMNVEALATVAAPPADDGKPDYEADSLDRAEGAAGQGDVAIEQTPID